MNEVIYAPDDNPTMCTKCGVRIDLVEQNDDHTLEVCPKRGTGFAVFDWEAE